MSLITELLKSALERNASDIHIKPNQAPVIRINGELTPTDFPVMSEEEIRKIVLEMMPEHMKTENQDIGLETDFSYQEEGIGRYRVNVFMSQHVPTIAMRHVKTEIPSFDQINAPPVLQELAKTRRGLILISGATGSGKSTTLAALIRCINETQKRRIITVEDPIEYLFKDIKSVITQREVGLDTPSFHSALKHVLRQDPDIIMIGEMRDHVSLSVAISAAETGHLVLSTLHTNTASQAVHRILDMFPATERDQARIGLSANLRAIWCQRLIPSVQGGVVPAVEILINTPTVRKLLQKNDLDTLPAAIETGEEDGMQTFNKALYNLIKEGKITEAQGIEQAPNPEALRMNLQGIFLDEGRRIIG